VTAAKISCPACGGPILFKIGSSMVAVCEYCHSVVARGDRKLEDLGKVADLVDTGAVLQTGLQGRYRGIPFELTGRAQLGHEAGGTWDEWYAHLADGRWGWLAEAQGRYYLTFQQTSARDMPPFAGLRLGEPLAAPPPGWNRLVLAEKGQARAVSAEGEIPYRLVPNATYRYADLSGPQGEFGTIDYSEEPPVAFLGQAVTLDDLGVSEWARRPEREPRQAEGIQLNCPACGGPLELRAPDRTERVACPNCSALLDANQGKLRLLQALHPARVKPVLPLGAVGNFGGRSFTVIGFMKRAVTVEGVHSAWDEYLLYHPRGGFRWLVRSNDQWSLVESVAPGEVAGNGRHVEFRGKTFRLFDKQVARVGYVLGEFYWKVTVGEEVEVADYVRPPEMLSREASQTGETREINWSLGTYLRPQEVERAFELKLPLRHPLLPNVAPNQPFLHRRIYAYWGILVLAGAFLGVLVLGSGARHRVFEHTFTLQPTIPGKPDQSEVIFSEPFDLQARRNIAVTASAQLDNSWVDIEGDLFNEDSGEVQTFSLPVSYYHGIDGGESWSEGSSQGTVYLSALPAGQYTLRLEMIKEQKPGPVQVSIQIVQGVPRVLHWVLLLVFLSIVPLGVLAYHFYFELCRWQDSPYSPFHSR
jgi:Domain of unknown function (DUF4178)